MAIMQQSNIYGMLGELSRVLTTQADDFQSHVVIIIRPTKTQHTHELYLFYFS